MYPLAKNARTSSTDAFAYFGWYSTFPCRTIFNAQRMKNVIYTYRSFAHMALGGLKVCLFVLHGTFGKWYDWKNVNSGVHRVAQKAAYLTSGQELRIRYLVAAHSVRQSFASHPWCIWKKSSPWPRKERLCHYWLEQPGNTYMRHLPRWYNLSCLNGA